MKLLISSGILITGSALLLQQWDNGSVLTAPTSRNGQPDIREARAADPVAECTAKVAELVVNDPAVTVQFPTLEQPASRTSEDQSLQSLKRLRSHLEDCLKACLAIPGYTAVLEQQVRIRGGVREVELVDLKFRRAPFSVFLFWRGDEQEVLYVEGRHDGRLLAHPTRGLTSFRRVWKIRPDSAQAMKSSRYPVTQLGIEKLAEEVLRFHMDRGFHRSGVTIEESPALVDNTPCRKFSLTFSDPVAGGEYSRSVLTFDPATRLLLSVENDGWSPAGEPDGLLERYVYHNVQLCELTESDFDPANPRYHFVERN